MTHHDLFLNLNQAVTIHHGYHGDEGGHEAAALALGSVFINTTVRSCQRGILSGDSLTL